MTSGADRRDRAAKIPAYDEAEESLLGCMLMSIGGRRAARERGITTQMFHVPRLGTIFDGIVAVEAAGGTVEPVTVAAACNGQGVTPKDLRQLEAATPASANAGAYAALVFGAHLDRRRMALAGELADAARNGGDTAAVVAKLTAIETLSSSDRRAADRLLAGLRDGVWLGAQDFPPLGYAVPGIVPAGFTLLVGAPKIGKSWLTLDIALGLACGGVALGRLRTGDPRPVLLCALEDGERRLQDRCRKLLPSAAFPSLFQYLTRIEPGSVFDTIGVWLDAQDPDSHPVVILDTLGKIMPPASQGESPYQRDYRIGSILKRLVDDHVGASLIVNHHDRKAGSEDFIDAVSGTHGLAGAADTTIVLARNRHETVGVVKVTGRDVREAEYAVKIVDGIAWQLDGDDLDEAARKAGMARASASLGDRSIDVLAFVNENADGVTPKQVNDELGVTDSRVYLARLAESGRIRKLARGLYAPLLQPLQVLRTDDSEATLESNGSNGSNTLLGALGQRPC